MVVTKAVWMVEWMVVTKAVYSAVRKDALMVAMTVDSSVV